MAKRKPPQVFIKREVFLVCSLVAEYLRLVAANTQDVN